MYLCTRYDSALWYLCHKTPLKIELKSPGIEFSLKFPHSWLAENLLITLYSWYHSWILNERFSCEHWFLWLRVKGVFFVSVCVCVCMCVCVCVCVKLIVWIVVFLAPEIFYLHLLKSIVLIYIVVLRKAFYVWIAKGYCKCNSYSCTIRCWRPTSELVWLKGFLQQMDQRVLFI